MAQFTITERQGRYIGTANTVKQRVIRELNVASVEIKRLQSRDLSVSLTLGIKARDNVRRFPTTFTGKVGSISYF